jgi:hypothetical protein
MGVTPSDFNFLNQRFEQPSLNFEANAESIGGYKIEENSLDGGDTDEEGGKRKGSNQGKAGRAKAIQKMYIDPVDVQIANVYGGPIPKAKTRKPVLGHKSMNEEVKIEKQKTFNSVSGPSQVNGMVTKSNADVFNNPKDGLLSGVLE